MTREPLLRAMAGLALLTVLIVACVGAALSVRRHLGNLAEQLRESQEASARLEGALARGQQIRDASAADGAAVFAADYLESAQDSIATADLQSRLRTMALEKRVELVSLNTLAARQTGDVTFVGVRLAFRAPLPAVQALLHATETVQPILFVERLTMRADPTSVRSGDVREQGAPLSVEMDVYAPKRPRALAAAVAPAMRVEPAPGGLRP